MDEKDGVPAHTHPVPIFMFRYTVVWPSPLLCVLIGDWFASNFCNMSWRGVYFQDSNIRPELLTVAKTDIEQPLITS
eukprot:562950-Amphidinium_carterae.1